MKPHIDLLLLLPSPQAGPIGGVSQMEALIKFAKYLVTQRRYSKASEIVQRMLSVNSFITADDKVSPIGYCYRIETISRNRS